MIETTRLRLLPATAAHLRAELDGREALARALGVQVPPSWPPDLYDAEAIRYTVDWLAAHPGQEAWALYHLVHRPAGEARGVLVGVGGFKGPPDAGGAVEIGYAVVSDYQRRGFATEAVRGLVERAFSDPEVAVVTAQTLTSLEPSIGVLLKAGFHFVGEGHDPDAPAGERVVRYAYHRPPKVTP